MCNFSTSSDGSLLQVTTLIDIYLPKSQTQAGPSCFVVTTPSVVYTKFIRQSPRRG